MSRIRRIAPVATSAALSVVSACGTVEPVANPAGPPPAPALASASLPAGVQQAIDQAEAHAPAPDATAYDLRQEYGVATTISEGPDRKVVRTSRLRLRDRAGTREKWLHRTHVYAQDRAGAWKLVRAQDQVIYEGGALSDSLHSRYGGTFMIAPGKVVRLAWRAGMLLATLPEGSTRQVFLASPVEEAVHEPGAAHLRFTLSDDGKPATVASVQGGKEEWRATRSAPE